MGSSTPSFDVVVVGSVNMDLVVSAPEIPAPGQTVLGSDFKTISGGKGANQAVAAARLGARVAVVGRVGEDAFGQSLREGFTCASVDCGHLRDTAGVASGVALIVVAESGQNAICVAAGANARVGPDDVERAADLIAKARVCVVQLEIPLETAVRAVAIARRHGVGVVLDPAPAPEALPDELFAVDVLTPNESEAARLLGLEGGAVDPDVIARCLRERGAGAVVLTLGETGCLACDSGGSLRVGAHAVEVVDTTAAGDAFTGALAVALAEGRCLREGVAFANAAGALACTRFGAQPSLPTRPAVVSLLESQPRVS